LNDALSRIQGLARRSVPQSFPPHFLVDCSFHEKINPQPKYGAVFATLGSTRPNDMFASANSREKYRKRLKTKPDEDASSEKHSLQDTVPKEPRSLVTRRLRNVTTILHLALLRRDIPRAERAFALLLRSEKHGVSLTTLWELGLEILLRSSRVSATTAEEFLGRVRLTSSDIGHHPTAEKQVCIYTVKYANCR
jgi:hypothetical protein